MDNFKVKEFDKCKDYIENNMLDEILYVNNLSRIVGTSWLCGDVYYGDAEYKLYSKKDKDSFCKLLMPKNMNSVDCDFSGVISYSGDKESLNISFINKKDGIIEEEKYSVNNSNRLSDITVSCTYNEYDDSNNILNKDNLMLMNIFSKKLCFSSLDRLTSRVNVVMVERNRFSTFANVIVSDRLTDAYSMLRKSKEISDNETSIIEIAECLKNQYLKEKCHKVYSK